MVFEKKINHCQFNSFSNGSLPSGMEFKILITPYIYILEDSFTLNFFNDLFVNVTFKQIYLKINLKYN